MRFKSFVVVAFESDVWGNRIKKQSGFIPFESENNPFDEMKRETEVRMHILPLYPVSQRTNAHLASNLDTLSKQKLL